MASGDNSGDNWVVIGRITKPFGIKGGFKVRPLTEDPDRFRRLAKTVLESPDGTRQTCTIAEVRVQAGSVTLFCREMNAVEQVERFIGGTVRIPHSDVIELPKDSYFQHDLIGLEVYREDGRGLGRVEEIWPTGSNDVLVVRDGKQERLIPAIKTVVIEVDLKRKRLVVRPMEGLFE
ncbi:MAG: 16S rRNA processing protein RimM [Nitrospirae bacterium]|nr:16S rRNA processing protein RimM [Nitrospirota bacterium]